MLLRRAFTAGALVLLAIAVVAIGVGGASAQSGAGARFDLSTNAGARAYLRSLGVNPRGVVIQRGARNYAGPSCPGKRWNCTKAHRVLQISTAAAGGTNTAVCSADNGGTVTGPGTNSASYSCTILQTNSGTNNATCNLSTDDSAAGFGSAAPITQTCTINQKNAPKKGTGKNIANVNQSITQSQAAGCGLPVGTNQQCATQTVSISQTDTSGPNNAYVTQALEQSLSNSGSFVSQAQKASMTFEVQQNGSYIPSCPITGSQSLQVWQTVNQSEDAGTAATGTQYQRSDMSGGVDQCSNSNATYTVNQTENQTQTPNSVSPSGITRIQIGPMTTKSRPLAQSGPRTRRVKCCAGSGFQGTNPSDTCTINQTSTQTSSLDATQIDSIGSAMPDGVSGTCTVSRTVTNNLTTSPGSGLNNGTSCVGSTCTNAQPGTVVTDVAPTVSPNPVVTGDAATLSATLTSGGSPLPDGLPVTLSTPNERCTALTSGGGGVASCSKTISEAPGTYTISASFDGAGPYASTTASKSFTVIKIPTTLVANESPNPVLTGDNATLSGTLTRTDTGAPISGKTVTLSVTPQGGGTTSESCSGTTDSSGIESCTVTITDPPGNYTLTASFAGDTYAASATGTYPFTVVAPTFLGYISPLNNSQWNAGRTIPVKFTLGDASGVQLSDAAAGALASSGKLKAELSSSTSPSDAVVGPATVSYSTSGHYFQVNLNTPRNLAAGTYYVIVTYSGISLSTFDTPQNPNPVPIQIT
jgi:hypothetical protein